jgi:hypothetical protein
MVHTNQFLVKSRHPRVLYIFMPAIAPANPSTRRSWRAGLPPDHRRRVVRFVGYNGSFLLPPLYPILFPRRTTYLPASSEESPYRPSQDHHVITAKLLAIGTRVAICGALCPGVLPCPGPGHIANQQTLCSPQSIIYLPIAPGIPAHSLSALAANMCRLFH